MPTLATCQFIQSFCLHVIIYLTSYSSINKVLLVMDNSSNTVFTKKLLFTPAVSIAAAAIFSYYVTNTIPSDAESCEEQDYSKQKFVGKMMAKL